MTEPLVTLEQVRDQLRIDGTADDPWITLAIPAVTAAVESWCGGAARVRDIDGAPLPQAVMATLVELAYQFSRREGPVNSYEETWAEKGYTLSIGATALLQPLHSVVTA